jgi:hypothetical protein
MTEGVSDFYFTSGCGEVRPRTDFLQACSVPDDGEQLQAVVFLRSRICLNGLD